MNFVAVIELRVEGEDEAAARVVAQEIVTELNDRSFCDYARVVELRCPLTCEVCGDEPAARRPLMRRDPIAVACDACFAVWYDRGITDHEQILSARGIPF